VTLNAQQFGGEQLSMFATARDLRHNYTPGDYSADAHDGDPENMWEQKHDEAWEDGLYHQVSDEGVKTPVTVWHTDTSRNLHDGHHRVAAQYDADPDRLIPLNHI
jgi:hypothetical protein